MEERVRAIRLEPKHHLKFVIVKINTKSTVALKDSIKIKNLESILR